jgi:DNA adenine methylase
MNLPSKYPRSPLRYPGGKSRAVKLITSLIPENERVLVSPFLGGGSVELACSTKMEVLGFDIFEPLVNFWWAAARSGGSLASIVQYSYYPLDRERFYELQKTITEISDPIRRAAIFFVLNRASFSGSTLSGGMSPGHPRFNMSAIGRLEDFKVGDFHVDCWDFMAVFDMKFDAFMSLDPPYKNGQKLYGNRGDAHTDFNHAALAKELHKRDRWILSYNDSPEIRCLYEGYQIVPVHWTYGMGNDKRSREILIVSNDVRIPTDQTQS